MDIFIGVWLNIEGLRDIKQTLFSRFLFLRRKSFIPSVVLTMSEKQYFNKRSAVNKTSSFQGPIPFAVGRRDPGN